MKESGFKVLWIEAQVRGVLHGATDPVGGTRPAVRIEETGQLFWLVEGTTHEERQNLDRLRAWVDEAGRHVVVRGRLHAHAGNPPGLTVQRFRMIRQEQESP